MLIGSLAEIYLLLANSCKCNGSFDIAEVELSMAILLLLKFVAKLLVDMGDNMIKKIIKRTM